MSNGYSARFPLGQYPARFHREAAPLWLSAVATARGVAPPARGTWCDVGCGQGIDTVIFAATNPDMQFWGIDVDPDHIARARTMAASAGLSNAHFICADVRDPAALADLPDTFDFIIQHGIYSWVSDDIRAALHHFAATRVATGGVVLVHYMTQPGAAVFLAVQNMLLSLEGAGRDIASRINILRAMANAGAGFFAQYPHAVALLDRLAQDDPALVAHEYLGVEARAFSACEMITAFANIGLSYIGSANPIENYDTVSLPAKTHPVIAAEPLPALRETLRDVARNQHTRYDIYQNAPRKLTVEERWDAMRDQRYLALPGLPEPGGVTFRSPVGPVDGGPDIFKPLLSCFADGQADFARMVQSLGGQAGVAEQAVMMLMGAGALHPMRSDGPVTPSADRLADVLRNGQRLGLNIDQRIGSACPSNAVIRP